MPLNVENNVQQAAGAVDSSGSCTVGFDTAVGYVAATAGNTVLVLVICTTAVTKPADFTQDRLFDLTSLGGPLMYWWRLPVATGSETTWTLTATAGSQWMWRTVETRGLAVPPVTPVSQRGEENYDGTSYPGGLSFVTITGESGSATRLDVFKFAAAVYCGPATPAEINADSWSPTITSTTWTKIADYRTANGSGNNLLGGFFEAYSGNTITGVDESIGAKTTVLGISSRQTAADFFFGGVVSYAAADSAVLDPIVMGTGWEFGTHHGITGGPTAAPGPAQICDAVSGTHGTTYQVTTTHPKNGTYHLRITQSAAVGWVGWTTNTLGAGLGQAVFGGYVSAVSATTNPAVCWEFAPAAGTIAQIVYNVSTTKFGVRWGSGGTVAYQAGTTAVGAYAWIDLVAVFNATTWTLTWRIEESGNVPTTQTSPANLTAQTASTWSTARAGSATSQTCSFDYDDTDLSNMLTDYPLGRHKHVLLIPDTAVAATLSGSAGANMSAITNNAVGSTLTTTGAANVPALLDEVPPNFSATADGVAAVTAGTTDSVVIDMTTYTAAATERIDAVRLYMAGWAVSATAASFGLRADAGGSETVFVSGSTTHTAFNSTTTGSATVPGWYCKNYGDVAGWTQAKIDALQMKIGYSSDATPDIGALALYAEVAVFTDYVAGLTSREPVIPLAVGQQTTVLREVPGSFTY